MKKVLIGLFAMLVLLLGGQQVSLAHFNMDDDHDWVYIGTFSENEKYFIKEPPLEVGRKIYQATDDPLTKKYVVIAKYTMDKGGYALLLLQYDFLNKKQRILGHIQHDIWGEEISNNLRDNQKIPWEDVREYAPSELIYSVAKEYIIENKDIRALYEYNVIHDLDVEFLQDNRYSVNKKRPR